jgi:hypothetical protein
MNMRKIILFLLLIVCVYSSRAQKNIVLEKIRCFSATGPTMSFFTNNATRSAIAAQLSKTLLQFYQLPLSDSSNISNIEYLNSTRNIAPVDIGAIDPSQSSLHLYLDFFEIAPTTFFSYSDNKPEDSTLESRAISVFWIKGTLVRPDKTIAFSEQLNVVVSPSVTPGIGVVYKYRDFAGRSSQLVATPKGFIEMMKTATQILFNPGNQQDMVEMKISPAYFAENFITRKTLNLPRTYVATKQNISTYSYANKREMIRMGEPVYEEILLKGKKPQVYPADITAAIKSANHYASSDFVFLREECRDVVRDRNYLLKLTAQVDPDNMLPATFTNFLPGKFHYLFLEKDTLARFMILKQVAHANNKFFRNRVSNGIDTTFYEFSTNQATGVVYDYVVTGSLGDQNFSINCLGFTNTLKEIYLGNKLVSIAQGRFSPEKFVVFDASLSPELLNQLFMIGFNRFFE